MKRPCATKYSTWLQVAAPGKPAAYVMVIDIWHKAGEPYSYLLLKLDGGLNATEVAADIMQRLIDNNQLKPWVPVPPR